MWAIISFYGTHIQITETIYRHMSISMGDMSYLRGISQNHWNFQENLGNLSQNVRQLDQNVSNI